jgi:hypothetical protein
VQLVFKVVKSSLPLVAKSCVQLISLLMQSPFSSLFHSNIGLSIHVRTSLYLNTTLQPIQIETWAYTCHITHNWRISTLLPLDENSGITFAPGLGELAQLALMCNRGNLQRLQCMQIDAQGCSTISPLIWFGDPSSSFQGLSSMNVWRLFYFILLIYVILLCSILRIILPCTMLPKQNSKSSSPC